MFRRRKLIIVSSTYSYAYAGLCVLARKRLGLEALRRLSDTDGLAHTFTALVHGAYLTPPRLFVNRSLRASAYAGGS